MEIAILFFLVILNGLFAMSEMALVSSRKVRLQKLIDEGDKGARAAASLNEDPTRFMSAIQIGITSIGVLNGIVGESALAGPLAAWFVERGAPMAYAGVGSTILVVAIITYFSIVLGELAPKRIGQSHPEKLARIVAVPVNILAIATKPFVKLLSGSTNLVLRVLGIKDMGQAQVTEAEIHAVLAEGAGAGVIESHEHAMVRNVFKLDDRSIGSLMVPRADVACLDLSSSFEENLALAELADHARFPVVKGSLGEVVGVVNARKWLSSALRGGSRDLADQKLQAVLYVPETITGMELLGQFRSSEAQMAVVLDEYGEAQGIVTLRDLIEAITGEFHPRDPETSWALERADGSWLLDGHIPVPELKDRLSLDAVPEEEKGRYHTLSGMMMLLSGSLPRLGDEQQWEGWNFAVVDMDGKVIDKVLATRVARTTREVEDGSSPVSG